MQRLALFDLDNTLIDRNAAFRRWAAEFVTEHGLGTEDEAWIQRADGDGLVPREAFHAALVERFGIDEPDFLARYHARIVAHCALHEAAGAALTTLRDNGWRIGIVTNGEAEQQLAKIEAVGLPAYVDGIAVSGAEGVRKPEPRLFEIAARRCGARLDLGGWMVGDSPEADMNGGWAARLNTIWIRRGREWAGPYPRPDIVVDDVPSAVARLLRPA